MAKVTMLAPCAPPLDNTIYTDGMIELSYEQFIYFALKTKTVTINSLYYSGTDSRGGSYSGSGTNLPSDFNVSQATSEIDLVCVNNLQSNATYNIESTDLSWNDSDGNPYDPSFSSSYGLVSFQCFFDKTSNKYYVIPNFNLSIDSNNNVLQSVLAFTAVYDFSSPTSWFNCGNPHEPFLDCKIIGEVGTFTYTTIDYGLFSCPIYGEEKVLNGIGNPSMSVNVDVTELSVWPYSA